MITKEWLQDISDRFEKYIHSAEYPLYGDVSTNFPYIDVEIQWGDWKHEHLRLGCLLEDFCHDNHLIAVSHQEIETEEDGSDCYSAIHRYVILPGV